MTKQAQCNNIIMRKTYKLAIHRKRNKSIFNLTKNQRTGN